MRLRQVSTVEIGIIDVHTNERLPAFAPDGSARHEPWVD
jgi:hypothetical protein